MVFSQVGGSIFYKKFIIVIKVKEIENNFKYGSL